ncbi:MAG: metallophosphoesterase family protein [Pseudomonadota bacterium]
MGSVKVCDLGEIEGEVIGFGGVHSNLQALEALISIANGRTAICTGDVVAYCGDPCAVVAALREAAWAVVAGNCERHIAVDAETCGCGFSEGSVCDINARAWFAHAKGALDSRDRAWMGELPDIATFFAHGQRWAVLHGGATAINRFLWPGSPEAAFVEEAALLRDLVGPVDAVLAGHSGIAFQRRVAGLTWINAGSIGLPPHDGGRATRYAVIGPHGVRLAELSYDAEAAAHAMRAVGLSQGYDKTLLTGWWPSEEILPPELRRFAAMGDAPPARP